jgi:hypothetical protein
VEDTTGTRIHGSPATQPGPTWAVLFTNVPLGQLMFTVSSIDGALVTSITLHAIDSTLNPSTTTPVKSTRSSPARPAGASPPASTAEDEE